jgi:peptidoglycan hydrolase-like protein with peptidoglycan-binding domain
MHMIDGYRAELEPPLAACQGARGIQAQRVQEWLGLHGLGVAIDGDFGPATRRAVEAFQRQNGLAAGGAVDDATWRCLVQPLERASLPIGERPFGQAVAAQAQLHLQYQAREVGGDNRGPWVRHYCRGQSVAWCQGFASTIWLDAARACELEPPLGLELDGIWCLWVPRMVQEAKARGIFADGREGLRPTPGSMFFVRGGEHGWIHVGLVVEAVDGIMTTLEGNTNHDGSANGYEVARRIRRIASNDFAIVP